MASQLGTGKSVTLFYSVANEAWLVKKLYFSMKKNDLITARFITAMCPPVDVSVVYAGSVGRPPKRNA
jgi:hypothetical protein